MIFPLVLIISLCSVSSISAHSDTPPQPNIILIEPPPVYVIKCGHHEELSSCVTPCQPTCDFPTQPPCPTGRSFLDQLPQTIVVPAPNPPTQIIEVIEEPEIQYIERPVHHLACQKGCVCRQGYVRNDVGECVSPSECVPKCGIHAHFEMCGPRCQQTCDSQVGVRPTVGCARGSCVSGCFCNMGYVKDTRTRQCVRPSQCSHVCKHANEHWSEWAPSCVPTCDDAFPSWTRCINTTQYKPGCYCNAGLVRDVVSGKCCEQVQCPPKTCPANQVWSKCSADCEPTCSNPKPICTFLCKSGCVCAKGLYRNKRTGKCVPRCECPEFH